MTDQVASTPSGWYPDPAGEPQWRRWEGATWSTETMPYGPPPPDTHAVALERGSWPLLRAIAPWGLLAPAFAAAALAADSVTFGPLRSWYHAASADLQHNRPLPPVPTTGASSTIVTVTYDVVLFLLLFGIGAWLRYVLAATRLTYAAGYPTRRHAGWTCVGFLVPFLGPWIAWSASREWLPTGHEARRVLATGWALVGLGEVALLALLMTTVLSSSLGAAWAVAGACGLVWLAAAVELPRGLEAIADDHASLGVRRTPVPS
jgi:hypothetical protein